MSKITSRPIRRALIVRLSSIGDAVVTSPVVGALKDHFPGIEVDWVVGKKSVQVVQMCTEVDRIFLFPKLYSPLAAITGRQQWREMSETLSSLRQAMHEREYDIAIDVQGLLKSGVANYLSGAAVRMGWRPSDCREFNWLFSNHWAACRRGMHVVHEFLSILAPLGITDPSVRFSIKPPEDVEAESLQYLSSIARSRPIVVLNVGASKPNKIWRVSKFIGLAKLLEKHYGALSLLTAGSDWEQEYAAQIKLASPESTEIYPKGNLFQLTAMLKNVDAYVGGDTGPTHLASAVGTPCVGIFGVTDPLRTGPYGSGNYFVSRYTPENSKTDPWKESAIMESITEEEVFEKLKLILDRLPAKNIAVSPQPQVI